MDSVETIMKSVQQTVEKVNGRLADASATRDTAQQRYDKLVEKQRKYYQLVKDYQQEMTRNEELSSAQG